MICSLRETLTLIRPYVPNRLIPSPALAHVQTVAEGLPDDAFRAHYFECRLGAAASQVDFSTCILARDGGRERLLDHNLACQANDSRTDHGWRGINAFVRDWADPHGLLYRRLPLVWLEFDAVNEPLPDLPLPGVNLCVEPTYLERRPCTQEHAVANRPDLLSIEFALEGLLGQPLSDVVQENLRNAFTHLPGGGQIFYLSAMLPREPATVKVNGIIPTDQLLPYLAAIGWRGSTDEVQHLLETFCPAPAWVRFDLTVGPVLSPRLGIEFFSKGLPQSTAMRHRLLDQLVTMGICTDDKRGALLTWAGCSRERYSGQPRPMGLYRSWYIKVVYNTGCPLEAKAYLGFTPGVISPFGPFSFAGR
jgi:hypothetical protein